MIILTSAISKIMMLISTVATCKPYTERKKDIDNSCTCYVYYYLESLARDYGFA
jgi:hypothetical protein